MYARIIHPARTGDVSLLKTLHQAGGDVVASFKGIEASVTASSDAAAC